VIVGVAAYNALGVLLLIHVRRVGCGNLAPRRASLKTLRPVTAGRRRAVAATIQCVERTHGLAADLILLVIRENLGETPDFAERVVQRRRRGADDIRFPEIAFHAGGFEFLEQFFWMFVR
jgi:hypothetical protein